MQCPLFMTNVLLLIALTLLGVAAIIIFSLFRRIKKRHIQFSLDKKRFESFIEKNLDKYLTDNSELELRQAINAQLINDTHFLMRSTLHDLASPIRYLDSIGTDLISNWNKLDDTQRFELINTLVYTGKQIKYLGDEFISTLQFSIIKNEPADEYTISLASLVLKISPMYKWLFEIRDISLKIDIDKSVQTFCNPDMAVMLIRNLMEFLLQYSQPKSIKIVATKENTTPTIHILASNADTTFQLINDFSTLEILKNEKPLFHAISIAIIVSKAKVDIQKSSPNNISISIEFPSERG